VPLSIRFEAFRQPRRFVGVGAVAVRAGRPSSATGAGVRALPTADPGELRIASRYRRRESTRGQSWPVGYAALDLGQFDSRNQADARPMTRIDWTHALSLAATLVLAIGAIYILLFAKF
jgi:hypothetical protein